MEQSFWLKLWNKPQRGFHLPQVNPLLQRFLPALAENARILVPLCGKTLDLTWLSDKGYQVDGIELSHVAIDEYWQDRGVSPSTTEQTSFHCTQHQSLTLWQGDLFHLRPEQFRTTDLIYDRAALVAWPEQLRTRYIQKLTEFAKPGCQWLLICLDYPQREMQGPPFSVTPRLLKEQVSADWDIQMLETHDLLSKEPHFQGRGLSYLLESTWLLTRK